MSHSAWSQSNEADTSRRPEAEVLRHCPKAPLTSSSASRSQHPIAQGEEGSLVDTLDMKSGSRPAALQSAVGAGPASLPAA